MNILNIIYAPKKVKQFDDIIDITTNNHAKTIEPKVTEQSFHIPLIDFGGAKSFGMQMMNAFDLNSILALGQVFAHHIFGTNNALKNNHYTSLDQEKNIRINQLAYEILPILNNNSAAESSNEEFMSYYSNAPQWYRDIFEDTFE